MNPIARRQDVIVENVGPDTFVYDRRTDAAHSLSGVAGFVYQLADGTRSVDEITARMSAELAVNADSQLTEAALWQLEQADLLDAPHGDGGTSGMSRRDAMRRFGTALAAAAVTSIVAPTPAMARSAGGSLPPGKGGARPNKPKNSKKPKNANRPAAPGKSKKP